MPRVADVRADELWSLLDHCIHGLVSQVFGHGLYLADEEFYELTPDRFVLPRRLLAVGVQPFEKAVKRLLIHSQALRCLDVKVLFCDGADCPWRIINREPRCANGCSLELPLPGVGRRNFHRGMKFPAPSDISG